MISKFFFCSHHVPTSRVHNRKAYISSCVQSMRWSHLLLYLKASKNAISLCERRWNPVPNQRFYKPQKSRLQVVPKKSGQNIGTSASVGGRATWGTPLACPPGFTRALGFRPFFNSLQSLFYEAFFWILVFIHIKSGTNYRTIISLLDSLWKGD